MTSSSLTLSCKLQLFSIEESKGKQGEKTALGKVAGKQAQQQEQETQLLLRTLVLPQEVPNRGELQAPYQ